MYIAIIKIKMQSKMLASGLIILTLCSVCIQSIEQEEIKEFIFQRIIEQRSHDVCDDIKRAFAFKSTVNACRDVAAQRFISQHLKKSKNRKRQGFCHNLPKSEFNRPIQPRTAAVKEEIEPRGFLLPCALFSSVTKVQFDPKSKRRGNKSFCKSLLPTNQITPSFSNWLNANGYGNYHFEDNGCGQGVGGSFGGLVESENSAFKFHRTNRRPIVFVGGTPSSATGLGVVIDGARPSCGWALVIREYLKQGYEMSELYATTFGDSKFWREKITLS